MIDFVYSHILLYLTDSLEYEWIAIVIAIHTLTQVHLILGFILVVGLFGGYYGV